MDAIDRKLLDMVQLDGRGVYADFGESVGLSTTAVHGRLKKLIRCGIIKGWAAQVDPVQAGFPTVLLVRVEIDLPLNREIFADKAAQLNYIQECHLTSGKWNCCLKIRTPNLELAERLIAEEISSMKGVKSLQIEAVTQTTKETLYIPNSDLPI